MDIDFVLKISSSIFGLIALFLIGFQLKYQNKFNKFEALTRMHEELKSDKLQKALRFVYNAESKMLINPGNTVDLEKIELVLNTYDLLAYRVKNGVLPKKATIETEWSVLLRIWEKLEPFIGRERQERHEYSYKKYLCWIVSQSQEYKKKNYPLYGLKIIDRSKIQ